MLPSRTFYVSCIRGCKSSAWLKAIPSNYR